MSNIKLLKTTNTKSIKKKLKKLQDTDGFIAITIKREGFYATWEHVRHSMSDEEIIYGLENLKLQLLEGE